MQAARELASRRVLSEKQFQDIFLNLLRDDKLFSFFPFLVSQHNEMHEILTRFSRNLVLICLSHKTSNNNLISTLQSETFLDVKKNVNQICSFGKLYRTRTELKREEREKNWINLFWIRVNKVNGARFWRGNEILLEKFSSVEKATRTFPRDLEGGEIKSEKILRSLPSPAGNFSH